MLVLFLLIDRNWNIMFLPFSMLSVFGRHGPSLIWISLYQGILFWEMVVLAMFAVVVVLYFYILPCLIETSVSTLIWSVVPRRYFTSAPLFSWSICIFLNLPSVIVCRDPNVHNDLLGSNHLDAKMRVVDSPLKFSDSLLLDGSGTRLNPIHVASRIPHGIL